MKDWCYEFATKMIGAFVRCLPHSVALVVGGFLGRLGFWLAARERTVACTQLERSLNLSDGQHVRFLVKRCFENLGKTAIEFLRFPRMSARDFQEYVRFEGVSHVKDALARGKGAIILSAHFGNWELLAASLSAHVAPLTPIVRELRSVRLNALVQAYRAEAGYLTIDRTRGLRHALRCLKRNELIGIVADVDTRVNGVFVDFFGRLAYTPYSPVAIALKTGAAILPAFIVRQSDGSHKAIIEPPLVLQRTDGRELELVINTQKFTKIIEAYILQYPEQWIWMHERWKTRPNAERKQAC